MSRNISLTESLRSGTKMSSSECRPTRRSRAVARGNRARSGRYPFRNLGNVVQDLEVAGRGLKKITLASLREYRASLPSPVTDVALPKLERQESCPKPTQLHSSDSPLPVSMHQATPPSVSLVLPRQPSNATLESTQKGSLEDVLSPRPSRFSATILPWSSLSSASHPKTKARKADKRFREAKHVTIMSPKPEDVTIVPTDCPCRKRLSDATTMVNQLARYVAGKPAMDGDLFAKEECPTQCPPDITFAGDDDAWDHDCPVSQTFQSPTTRKTKNPLSKIHTPVFTFDDKDDCPVNGIKWDHSCPVSSGFASPTSKLMLKINLPSGKSQDDFVGCMSPTSPAA